LVAATQNRLRELTERMLRKFRRLVRWVEVDEVLSNACMRLLKALEGVPVADTRGFFNLAAAVTRRELIDLARHFYGPLGVAANHDSAAGGDSGPPVPDREDRDPDPADLDHWATFHAAVEALPPEEREVFGLIFYHRWEQAQIAELFGVDERTVRRRFQRAAAALHAALGGELPEG
jgi:RNA polymerase sigma-70 factor (ECF subfamily)